MRSLACSGHDRLVDGLLIGWWWGNQESAWSAFWFQWSEVYVLVSSMQLLPPGEGFSICQTDKDIIVCIPWRGIRTCPKAALLFLDFFSTVFTSLPFPYSVQFSSVAQLCPTLCDPMDCSMPGFSVHHLFEPAWWNLSCLSDLTFYIFVPSPVIYLFYFIFGMWDPLVPSLHGK